jgi:ABC-type glycerol-3-phosphate transport system permease component
MGTPLLALDRAPAKSRLGRPGQICLYLCLALGAFLVLLPYVWMINSSFSTDADVFRLGLNAPAETYSLRNYVAAWTEHPLGRWLLNTMLVAAIETSSTLVTSILAGFALARLRFWGRDTVFVLYLGAMMVPIQVTLIPSFFIVRSLGLLNSYSGIAALHLVQFFGVFLMRQFLLNLPSELEDAARIDGCSWFRVLWQIILPVSRPAVASLAVFAFAAAWNEFLWPLVIINRPAIMTIQVGLATMTGGLLPWGELMAATTLSAVPMLATYVVLQQSFTQGIVLSGLKG